MSTTKTTIRFNDADHAAIERAKRLSGQRTEAKAIRWALRKAVAPPPPPAPAVAVAVEVLNFLRSRIFISPIERQRLQELTAKLYNAVTNRT